MNKQLFAVTALAVGLAAGSIASAGNVWSVSVGVGGPGYAGAVTVGSPWVPVPVCQPAPVCRPAPVCVVPPVVYYPPVVYAPAPVVHAAPHYWGRPVMVAAPHGWPMGHGPGYPAHRSYGRR